MRALIVGHPGHELRVHGWLSTNRPLTFILTDGSGGTGTGRLASSDAVLRECGAERSEAFVPLPDAAAYRSLLSGEPAPFFDIATAIARELVARRVTNVYGDAWEGYNPVHDLCRLIIDTAVAIAEGELRTAIGNWSFPLAAPPDALHEGAAVERASLDDAAFARKFAAAERYVELAPELQSSTESPGREAFRHEVFTKVVSPSWDDTRFLGTKPFYELHGESRVSSGKYSDVIRYLDHVRPMGERLRQFAATHANPVYQ